MSSVSIIVPVYNVRPFLKRCLDSIIGQTYENIEVLLIDDGSNDGSGEICDEYAIFDPRVKVIHKSNGGVSSARNVGLDCFNGDYVMFVDSDDVIEPDMVETLVDHASSTDSEIICCLLDVVEIDGTTRTLTRGETFGKINSSEVISKYFDDPFIKDQMYGPFNKLFSRQLIDKHYFSDYRLGEDILFIFELLLDCNSVTIIDYIGYHYIHREGSAMTSPFSEKRLDYIYAGEKIVKLCKSEASYALEAAQRWLYRHRLVAERQILMNGLKTEFSEFYESSKKELKDNKKYVASLPIGRWLDYFGIMYCPVYFSLLKFLKRL